MLQFAAQRTMIRNFALYHAAHPTFLLFARQAIFLIYFVLLRLLSHGIDKPAMLIRSAKPGDAAAIANILTHYILHTTISFQTNAISENLMQQKMADIQPPYPFLVAVDSDGSVAGFAYAHPWRSYEAYNHTAETTVYLHPDFCNRGIGRTLMSELIEKCRVAGLHSLIACVTQDNAVSKRFHLSLGFVQVSHLRQVGYKFGKWLDVLDFQLIL